MSPFRTRSAAASASSSGGNAATSGLVVKLPNVARKRKLDEAATFSELAKSRKAAAENVHEEIKKEEDVETDMEEAFNAASESEEEIEPALVNITVKLQCLGDPDASTARGRAPVALGAHQTVVITHDTSLQAFVDLVSEKAKLQLSDKGSAWEFAIMATGRGSPMKEATALNPQLREGQLVYATWRDALRAGQVHGTIVVTGLRKVKQISSKDKEKTTQTVAVSPLMDPKTMDAMLVIFAANVCNDPKCLQKSALHPACWPIVGANPGRHLVLTNEATHRWAVALADGTPNVTAKHPPLVAPYVITEKSPGLQAQPGSHKSTPLVKKERVAHTSAKLEHAQETDTPRSDGGIEFLGALSKRSDLGIFNNLDLTAHAPRQRLRYGRQMTLQEFAGLYDLTPTIIDKLLEWDIRHPAAAAEMSDEHMELAKLSMGESLELKAAIGQWRDDGPTGVVQRQAGEAAHSQVDAPLDA